MTKLEDTIQVTTKCLQCGYVENFTAEKYQYQTVDEEVEQYPCDQCGHRLFRVLEIDY